MGSCFLGSLALRNQPKSLHCGQILYHLLLSPLEKVRPNPNSDELTGTLPQNLASSAVADVHLVGEVLYTELTGDGNGIGDMKVMLEGSGGTSFSFVPTWHLLMSKRLSSFFFLFF